MLNIFLKLEDTVLVSININMLFKDFITEIILKKFPILTRINVNRIYIISHTSLYLSPKHFETKLKDLDYFFDNNTYRIKVLIQ